MSRSLAPAVAAEAASLWNRPFTSAIFHFGGSVGDIAVADHDITINTVLHKGIVTRWAEFRSVIEPREGSFQVGRAQVELSNAATFGSPKKRFSDLWPSIGGDNVEVDLYQNFLKIGDPATVIQDKIHTFTFRTVSHTPERGALVDLVSASEKYLDKKEISFPLSQADFPLIKTSEIGAVANVIYGAPLGVRAHQAAGFPTSVLAAGMDDTQTTLPLYPDFNALLPASGTLQIGLEQCTYGSLGPAPTVTTQSLTSGADLTTTHTFTTASISPVANRLITLWIGNRKNGGSSSPSVSGGGLTTWVKKKTITGDGGDYRYTLFHGMSAAPGSGAITITFGGVNQESCVWSVLQHGNVDTSGANGAGAIAQVGSRLNGTTVNLGAFESASNATVGGFLVKAATSLTAESGFTQLANLAGNNFRVLTEWLAAPDTTPSVTAAGGTEAFLGIAIELRLGNVTADIVVQRGANATTAEAHVQGEPVVFFPSTLKYLLAGHTLKSVAAVAIQKGNRRVPVKSARYSLNLADTSLVPGRTVSSLTFSVPPLTEERTYKQTCDGATITLNSGGTSATATFTFTGGQAKTKSSGFFRYTIPWQPQGSLGGANMRIRLVRGSDADITLYQVASAGAITKNAGSPFIFLDTHFHSGSGTDKLQIVLEMTSGTAASTKTIDIDQITVEYLVASALDDPLPALSGPNVTEVVQEANGGALQAVANSTVTMTLDFGAQLKPKARGKYRYSFTYDLWIPAAGEAVTRLEVLLGTNTTHRRQILYFSDDSGNVLKRADGNVSFEDDHYHSGSTGNKCVVSLKTGGTAPVAAISLARLAYDTLEPGADVNVQALQPTTTADFIVGGDVVFDCEGYADDGSGTYTGTAGALIENAADVIAHLAQVPGALPAGKIDIASFQQAKADLPDFYKFAGVVTERSSNLKELLLALGAQARLKVDWPVDKLTARVLKTAYDAPTKTITEKQIVPGSLRVSPGPMAEVVNKINLRYGRDWSLGRSEQAFSAISKTEDSASIAKYGEKKQDDKFWYDFIASGNPAMAGDMAAFRLAWLKEPPRMVELRAWLDQYELLVGDVRGVRYLFAGSEVYNGLDGAQKLLALEAAHVLGALARGELRQIRVIFREVA